MGDKRKMTVLEKIKRCVELVWDFEEIYDWSDIEAFCDAELSTYPQHDEILDYFKRIAELEKENAELKETLKTYNGCGDWDNDFHTCRVYLQHEELQKCEELLTKAKKIIEQLLLLPYANNEEVYADVTSYLDEAEQFLKDNEVEK